MPRGFYLFFWRSEVTHPASFQDKTNQVIPLFPLDLLFLLSDLFLYVQFSCACECNFLPNLHMIAHLVSVFCICTVIVVGTKWLSNTEFLWHHSKHLQTPEVRKTNLQIFEIVCTASGYQWPLLVLTCCLRLTKRIRGWYGLVVRKIGPGRVPVQRPRWGLHITFVSCQANNRIHSDLCHCQVTCMSQSTYSLTNSVNSATAIVSMVPRKAWRRIIFKFKGFQT